MKKIKHFSAKKYFMYALPTAIIYKIIAFFTINRYFPGMNGRLIDFAVIIAILLFCLFKSGVEVDKESPS